MPRGKGVGSEEGGWVVTKAESIPISEMRQEDLADPGEWYARMKALQRWLRNVPMQWPKGYLDEDDVHSFVRSWVHTPQTQDERCHSNTNDWHEFQNPQSKTLNLEPYTLNPKP
jgi:hypothetical protein